MGFTMDHQIAKKWLERMRFVRGEYPFGPRRETRNEAGELHNEPGGWSIISPFRCIQFENGRRHGLDVDKWGSIAHYFRDVLVPAHFLHSPEKVTFEEVLSQRNTEVRRVGMMVYGFERMISEGKFILLDRDDEIDAELYKHENDQDQEPTVIVRVTDATPKEDGEYRQYILQVPPDMVKCREAVAWTFGKKAEEYGPIIET